MRFILTTQVRIWSDRILIISTRRYEQTRKTRAPRPVSWGATGTNAGMMMMTRRYEEQDIKIMQ